MSDQPFVFSLADRHVTPAFTLSRVGEVALSRARDGDRFKVLDLVTSQLMCALTLEAVLNHVGAKLFIDDAAEPEVWDAVERLKPKLKLEAIARRCHLELDFGSLPFQDFAPIFKFRNDLAHAKTLILQTNEVPAEAIMDGIDGDWLKTELVPGLQAEWEKACDIDLAVRWRESTAAMSAALAHAADCANPMVIGGITTYSPELTGDG